MTPTQEEVKDAVSSLLFAAIFAFGGYTAFFYLLYFVCFLIELAEAAR